MARHAVVARERVAPGGRKSRGRVALGEVDSPKGEGRVAPATCARRVRLAPASCPAWVDSLVCAAESALNKERVAPFYARVASFCARVAHNLCATRFVFCATRL